MVRVTRLPWPRRRLLAHKAWFASAVLSGIDLRDHRSPSIGQVPAPKVRHAPLAEILHPEERLGRHILHDEQSHDFVAQLARKIISVVHESAGLPLNQADVGSCTAEALTGAGNSQPNLPTGQKPRTQDDAYSLYHVETVLEHAPWPPNDPGGSGLMVCKAAKHLGWIKSYHHAFGVDQALRALVKRPVIVGVTWYDSFDRPDANATIQLRKGARPRGGHEFLLDEIIAEHELVGAWQSWGPRFGNGGKFYIPFSLLDELLRQQGDCTVPIFA